MPQPADLTSPARRPRHAAGGASHTKRFAALVSATSRVGATSEATDTARHRRPESLADNTRLRRPPAAPSANSRAADRLLDRGKFEDCFIERGFPGAKRGVPGGERSVPGAERGVSGITRAERRRAEQHRADALPDAGRRRGGRGKHAAPHDLAITVRPLPFVRDAVVDGLPAAKRAAGAFREWALYTGDKPSVMGTHRAPGTLPIESWLLVGKSRQQALLATLVAVGLMLIVVPVQQRQNDVNPVSAAGHAIDAIDGRSAKTKAPGGSAKHPAPAAEPTTPQATGKPTTSAPAKGPSSTPASPAVAVPQGAGPAGSLRTTGSDAVALTFDDGPDPVQTPKILAMLAEYRVTATFCLVGEQVQKHPEIVQQIVAAGHTLCNHTWDHSLVIGKDKPAAIQADLQRTNDAIHAAVPGAPIPFFRAPGGNFTDRLVQVAYADGMTSLYWQVDPRDWSHPEGEDDTTHVGKVVDGVREHVQPGSIVLSHDFNQPDTITAYETLLPWLTKNFKLGVPEQELPVSPSPSSPPPASPAAEATAQAGT
jgi:peptidoglycan/xylan/chitin deacetylase (PgdA/CDA1 family)